MRDIRRDLENLEDKITELETGQSSKSVALALHSKGNVSLHYQGKEIEMTEDEYIDWKIDHRDLLETKSPYPLLMNVNFTNEEKGTPEASED